MWSQFFPSQCAPCPRVPHLPNSQQPLRSLDQNLPESQFGGPDIKCSRENVCVAPNFLENSPALDQQENACSRQTPLPLLVLPKGLLFPAKFQVDTELEYLSNSSQ